MRGYSDPKTRMRAPFPIQPTVRRAGPSGRCGAPPPHRGTPPTSCVGCAAAGGRSTGRGPRWPAPRAGPRCGSLWGRDRYDRGSDASPPGGGGGAVAAANSGVCVCVTVLTCDRCDPLGGIFGTSTLEVIIVSTCFGMVGEKTLRQSMAK